jgi:hypothetical protein
MNGTTEPNTPTYKDCADVLLMLWTEHIITNGQYRKIMDRLNEWERRRERE